jgi:hypothetical protein
VEVRRTRLRPFHRPANLSLPAAREIHLRTRLLGQPIYRSDHRRRFSIAQPPLCSFPVDTNFDLARLLPAHINSIMDFNTNPQRPIAIQDESRMSQENRMPHPPQINRESDARTSPDHGQAHDQNMGGVGPSHEGMKPMKRACNDCRQQKVLIFWAQLLFMVSYLWFGSYVAMLCNLRLHHVRAVASWGRIVRWIRFSNASVDESKSFKSIEEIWLMFSSKYSEMQREIEELRWKLRRATQGALPIPRQDPSILSAEDATGSVRTTTNRELGHFTVSGELLDDLFKQYV